MEKSLIKKIIIEKQNEILDVKLMNRPIELEDGCNYVFIGLRRAGKSYLLFQYIKELIDLGRASIDDILYINFEDERLSSIKSGNLGDILDCYNELYEKKPIIFLDEIQNIIGWEKFARRLADAKYRVFITGSNAQMLSKEIYTTLGGRYLAKEVYPFSFSEYLSFNGIVLSKNWEFDTTLSAQIVRLFTNYFYYGGFAESFPLTDKRNWLNSLYHKILLGDVILRNNIRNDEAIRLVVKKLAESVMQPLSLARISNIVKSTGANISHNTLVEYLNFLSDAFLIFGISNYSDKLSTKETIKKRYFYDNGLLNNFLFEPETKLLENLVALSLKQKYGDDLFYYNKNIEVDFFIPKFKRAIQASYRLSSDITREREVKALLKIAEVYELNQLEIITKEEESVITENGITITVTPIWKWLINGV